MTAHPFAPFSRRLLALALLLLLAGPASATHLFISEFLTAGNATFLDDDGDTPDWIEIHNPTAGPLSLDGFFLTDDATNLTKWRFPDVSIDGGRFLVVFASDKNRSDPAGELHTNFKLTSDGEYLALVDPDGATVVHEFAPAFPPQEAGYSYGIEGGAPTDPAAYFSPPSPGRPNGNGLAAPLAAPEFSVKCATFTRSVDVLLTTSFPRGEIRYTTDGSVPTAASTLYVSPIAVNSTTRLRARVFDPATNNGGEVDTGFYTKLDPRSDLTGIDAPADFSSTLPILVLENFNTGGLPGPNSPLKYTQISVFEVDPRTGRASLSQTPDDCLHSGMRIRGASSAGFAKKQYRVEIWNEDNESRNVSLLGLPSENDWVLGAPYVDESLMRNAVIFEMGREMGLAASRTKYCEVFLNTNGGPITSSDYQGVYYVAESIKIDKNRVDVTPLDSLPADDPDGGYIIRHEAGVANKTRINGWNQLEIHDPEPVTAAQRNFISDFVNEFDGVLRTPRWDHPEFGYAKYIDVPSFIDTIVMNEFVREQDDYVRSAYLYKDRGGKLVNGPLWDYNLSFGISCCFNSHLTGVDSSTGSGWQFDHAYNRGARENGVGDNAHSATMARFDWYRLMLRDPDFMQAFIDRYQELRAPGNMLSLQEFFARIDRHAALLDGKGDGDSPAQRNFLKWGTLGSQQTGFQNSLPANLKNSQETWEAHVQFIKNWARSRFNWMDAQFLDPPHLNPPGGGVLAGSGITASSVEPVYYTTDGSDPRLPGGEINPLARRLDAPSTITINESTLVRTRARSAGGDWSAPVEAVFATGTPADASNLIISEMNYHPPNPSAADLLFDPTLNDDDFEWIELKNISDGPIELSGVSFVDGIDYQFPLGTTLPAGGYLVLVENQNAFDLRYGPGLIWTDVYANKLDNDGETVRLRAADGNDIAHFTFNDIWYRPTDGEGYTLVNVDESQVQADLSDPVSWGISCQLLGTPGSSNGSVLSLTFEGWLNYHFTAAERADPLVTGFAADLEQDGITTLMEFALGLDPRLVDSAQLPAPTVVGDGGEQFLSLTFRRQKKALDLIYRVQVSGNLVDWEESDLAVGPPVDNGDGTESVTIRDEVPIETTATRFIRLVVVKD